jgi:UDP-GlcNAc:undecaprenyl-phosphate GlcNAc-1-phosphate transferase
MLSALRYFSNFGSNNKRKLSVQHMDGYIFGAIVCATVIVAFILCGHALAVGTYFNLLDVPGDRKKHKHITPLMGGIVILATVIPAAFAIITFVTPETYRAKLLVWIAAVAGMTIIGILDDRHSLSPRARLLASFAIFGIAAYIEPIFNVRVLDFEYPPFSLGLGTRGIAIAFTILCCVGLVNAINMADGKNGLVIGLCIGWLILLATRAPDNFLPLIGLLIAVLLILLAFNLRGKLFLGDGGAYGFATAIAVIAIAIYNSPGSHATRAIAAEELALLFSVPILDSLRLTLKRLKRGQSPMTADRDHLHHFLQDRFGWLSGLVIYLNLAILPSFIFMYS